MPPGSPRLQTAQMRAAPLALLLSACHAGPVQEPVTPPAPPRNYAVATSEQTFVDTTRGTPANGDAPDSPVRTLPTTIWSPQGPGPFPLVLFVHGSSGFRGQSAWLMNALASDGYVVAAADFPLTSLVTPGGPSDWHVEDQPEDLRFLADQLHAKDYAVVGHSTGGTVALLAAQAPDQHDDRVRAAVSLSGDSCFFGDSFFSTRALPLLIVDATRDQLVPATTNGARSFALSRPPKMRAVLQGGTHLFFTDLTLPDSLGSPTLLTDPLARTLARYGGGSGCAAFAPSADPLLAIADQHRLAALAVRGFLDEVFRGEPFVDPGDPRMSISRQ
jgi:dienelactone hydrolase